MQHQPPEFKEKGVIVASSYLSGTKTDLCADLEQEENVADRVA